jgi:hypothetical protein
MSQQDDDLSDSTKHLIQSCIDIMVDYHILNLELIEDDDEKEMYHDMAFYMYHLYKHSLRLNMWHYIPQILQTKLKDIFETFKDQFE